MSCSRWKATALRGAIAALGSGVFLASCASQLPKAGDLPDTVEARQAAVQRFVDEAPDSVERIKVPRSSMTAVSVGGKLPRHIVEMPIDVQFPKNHEATLASLVYTLSAVNLQTAFQWSDPQQGQDFLARKLPFLSFQGTVGELMSALRTGMGVVTWYEDGLIYLSNQERYALALPQNKEVLEAIKTEIEALGAKNVVTSLRGGKVIYTAPPTLHDQVIGPFLDRMTRNLAVVNMQVAVVSLALNDNSDVGFDWNAFSVAFDRTAKGVSETIGAEGDLVGGKGVLTAGGLSFGQTSVWTSGVLTVASAVNFLSNFGTTNITQNASLKTLSGSQVKLQSGQEVPYVKGVSRTSNGDNSIGASDTDKVNTGLTLELDPYYDSDSEVVTVNVNVQLDAILDFIELSAGDQIGTLTQPMVQKQNMNDIIRVQAGRTVLIGGLQYDSDSVNGSEPAMLRSRLQGTGKVGGSRSQQVTRSALFIILRPTVTVYEPED